MSPDEARGRFAGARCVRLATADTHGKPRAAELLRERYAQYAKAPPDGPVLEVAVQRWSGWAA